MPAKFPNGSHGASGACASAVTNLLATLDPDALGLVIDDWLADRHAQTQN